MGLRKYILSDVKVEVTAISTHTHTHLWTLDPRSHSRLESLAEKETRAGGLLPDPDPEWARMLPVVPDEVRTRHE